MNEQNPRWYLISDLMVKCIALAGGVIMFIMVTRPAADVELARQKLEVEKKSKPLLHFKPIIEKALPYKDVRSIHFETELSNVGLTDVRLKRLEVEVYDGILKKDAVDKVVRTQEISDCLDVIRSPTSTEEQRKLAAARFEVLGKKCPHGCLFGVSANSKDVEWKCIDELTETRLTNTLIRPEQCISETFEYVLTESLFLHYSWLRFEVTVNRGEDDEIHFSFVVPMRNPPVGLTDKKTIEVLPTTLHVTRPSAEWERWTPDHSLMPMVPEKEPPKQP
jgi:hypothetical protein